MIKKFLWLIAMVGAVGTCGTVAGQVGNPSPISKPGGYASTELEQIYRQSIGQGFSGDSINSITLNTSRARNPFFGNQAGPQSVGPRLGLGAGGGPSAGKPFSSFSPPPTVSPYLNLFRQDVEGGSDFNYQTLVRPQLQQQQVNQQQQRQVMEFNRRLQNMSAQSDFNPQGSESQYPTGHQTVFRYYGRYHPTMNARARR
jgi:hypothetical protein